MTTDNQVKSFAYHDPAQPTEPVSIEQARRLATTALSDLVGSEDASFSLVSEADQGTEGVRFTWERAIPDESTLKLQATSLVRGGLVSEVKVTPDYTTDFEKEFRANRNRNNPEKLFTFLSVMMATLALAAFYLLSLSRGEIDHRSTLVLFAAVFLLGSFITLYGNSADESIVNASASDMANQWGRRAKLLLQPLAEVFFYALGLALLWSVGLALARRRDTLRVASLAGLLKGHLLSKPIAWRVAIGLLLGGIVSAVPYLVAASNLFPGMEVGGPNPELFATSAPALTGFSQCIGFMPFLLYGFLVPLMNRHIRATRVVRLVGVVVGWIWLIDSGVYESSILGALTVSGLTIVILDEIYWRYDLLALCAALLASSAATSAWSLLVQPSDSLRLSGGRALMGLGVLLVIALASGLKGREVRLEDELPTLPIDTNPARQRAERERLMAEFDVARQAQQRMLPTSPPQIPGYEIAASCRPAREVGGDLYDFLTLPNERIGIVVADVSGKGVPAALYMTLTKGLLASIAENESDPSLILREVNRHLYEVCGRKMFVTMILGVLDPATQTLTYARAGHNPGVWRSVQSQTHTLLRAPGLGLGLNKGKLFNRSLRLESIQVKPGDALLFYSDGITEAMNGALEEYGEERLLTAVASTDGLSAAQTQDAILADVNEFLNGTPPQDDMTLVVVRVGY
ncbi:MAG: PP2C family protein-serine/threonine phosphatase [Pyrinomonadaceae bacterium]|nr:PP2C family protein-serine/threonine phosphatase [Pyrinomonadaceae bacterium]